MEITIRYPKISDIQDLCDYLNDLSQEKTYMAFQGEKFSIEEQKSSLKRTLAALENRTMAYLFAYSGDILVGEAEIAMGDRIEAHLGRLGFSVRKEFRRCGIGDLLLTHLIEEGKKTLPNLEIITLGVFAINRPAIKFYEKHGFKLWGNLPQGIIHQGERVDSLYYYLPI